MMCQSGEPEEAARMLQGYSWKLAQEVLRYQLPSAGTEPLGRGEHSMCALVDGAIGADLAEHLRGLFGGLSSFWNAHQYHVMAAGVASTPYFSYLHRLSDQSKSSIDQAIRQIQQTAAVTWPEVME